MRVKNVRLWVAVGIVAAVLGIFFWQNSRRVERNYRIIFIPKVIDEDNDFWKQLIEGVEMAAAENKMELTMAAPETENLYEAQDELIEWAC